MGTLCKRGGYYERGYQNNHSGRGVADTHVPCGDDMKKADFEDAIAEGAAWLIVFILLLILFGR